jgi:hypothetical protein
LTGNGKIFILARMLPRSLAALVFLAMGSWSYGIDPAAAGTYVYDGGYALRHVQVGTEGVCTIEGGRRGRFNKKGVAYVTLSKSFLFSLVETLTLVPGEPFSIRIEIPRPGRPFPSPPLVFTARKVIPSPTRAGRYTVIQAPPADSTFTGYGWSSMTITRSGAVRQVGRLANGVAYSLGSAVVPGEIIPIAGNSRRDQSGYYGGFSGELVFQSPADDEAFGEIRSSADLASHWSACRFVAPQEGLNLLDPGSTNLDVESVVSGMGFAPPFITPAMIRRHGIQFFGVVGASVEANIREFKWHTNGGGELTGRFQCMIYTPTDTFGHRVDGVVYQKQRRAVGMIVGINGSASFEVHPMSSPTAK